MSYGEAGAEAGGDYNGGVSNRKENIPMKGTYLQSVFSTLFMVFLPCHPEKGIIIREL